MASCSARRVWLQGKEMHGSILIMFPKSRMYVKENRM